MTPRYIASVGLTSLALLLSIQETRAQLVHMMESSPSASAVIDGRSDQFFVRFDRPVDHARSRLSITQNGKVIELLHPSLSSAPEVLFAQAPRLPQGNYELHWEVITIAGAAVTQGDIPFTVRS